VLQIAAWLLGFVFNVLVTYEAIRERQRRWKIAIPAVTAVGLLAAAAGRAGLLNFQDM
jgi:uncharacterized membrane protein AbrB (regulator of aidB expression)